MLQYNCTAEIAVTRRNSTCLRYWAKPRSALEIRRDLHKLISLPDDLKRLKAANIHVISKNASDMADAKAMQITAARDKQREKENGAAAEKEGGQSKKNKKTASGVDGGHVEDDKLIDDGEGEGEEEEGEDGGEGVDAEGANPAEGNQADTGA